MLTVELADSIIALFSKKMTTSREGGDKYDNCTCQSGWVNA